MREEHGRRLRNPEGPGRHEDYFEPVFVVTRALDAYREAHSTPVPELVADHPLHHENFDDHFAVT